MLKRIAILTLIALGLFLAGTCLIHSPSGQPAAQSFEPFTKTFNLPVSASAQIIPMCSTSSVNCIPDYKQVSHSVTFTMTGLYACSFQLDASADNIAFFTIAANSTVPGNLLTTLTAQANGYYPYLRIKVPPCASAVTVSYTGYSSAQIISYTGYPFVLTVSSFVTNGYGFLSPTVLQGLTCTNSDTTNTAWLSVVANQVTQTVPGFTIIWTPVGPGATYTYSGPPISLLGITGVDYYNYLYLRGCTSSACSATVTNPFYCNVEMNGSGPYYPFFPPSP